MIPSFHQSLRNAASAATAAIKLVCFFFRPILGIAVAFLQHADQLVLPTLDHLQIVVREFSPLLLEFPLHLLQAPVTCSVFMMMLLIFCTCVTFFRRSLPAVFAT